MVFKDSTYWFAGQTDPQYEDELSDEQVQYEMFVYCVQIAPEIPEMIIV